MVVKLNPVLFFASQAPLSTPTVPSSHCHIKIKWQEGDDLVKLKFSVFFLYLILIDFF